MQVDRDSPPAHTEASTTALITTQSIIDALGLPSEMARLTLVPATTDTAVGGVWPFTLIVWAVETAAAESKRHTDSARRWGVITYSDGHAEKISHVP